MLVWLESDELERLFKEMSLWLILEFFGEMRKIGDTFQSE
jgi:hypothetical protein